MTAWGKLVKGAHVFYMFQRRDQDWGLKGVRAAPWGGKKKRPYQKGGKAARDRRVSGEKMMLTVVPRHSEKEAVCQCC